MFDCAAIPATIRRLPVIGSLLSIVCLLLAAGQVAAAPGAGVVRYAAQPSSDLRFIALDICAETALPRRFYAERTLRRKLQNIRFDGRDSRPRWQGDLLSVPAVARCLSYRVRLDESSGTCRWRLAQWIGRDLLTEAGDWLLMPPGVERAAVHEIHFTLPPGISVSAPWPDLPAGGGTAFRLALTPPDWGMQVAFGRFVLERIPVGNVELRVAMLDSNPPIDRDAARVWVREAAAAVLAVRDTFPQPDPQVMLVPASGRGEAVPFARVVRGGGVALQFFVDPSRPLAEYRADWTATHEFSHLLLPYVRRSDAWMSEGLASYYQNVLRARDGRLSEAAAWHKLYEGFMRGIRATSGRYSLADEAASGDWRRNTMRVYWGGAAYWLLADTELRRRSAGRLSVDRALSGLAACCMDPGRLWSAREMARQLDRITATTVFSDLYEEQVRARDFPPALDALRTLGVDIEDNRAKLDPDAPDARIRDAIMRE